MASKIVMVRNKNGEWRMCIDFTYLNKCCPKDDFPLMRINKIIDSTVGCEMMVLLNCFSGYQQIWLCKEDEEKTSFITHFRTYCYLRILEGLCNAGLTFCRMMKAALKDQVSRNVLSYVDDIVIASKKKDAYISNLAETFVNMHEARIKLNLEKCICGITRGKVHGCLVSIKGIEANPNKIRAITQMQPSQSKKRCLEAHMPNSILESVHSEASRTQPPILCYTHGLCKNRPQSNTFDDLKHYLEYLSTLSSLEQGQPLILYVSATHSVVSGALAIEKETVHNDKIVKQHFPV
jgi:hypothetical protein